MLHDFSYPHSKCWYNALESREAKGNAIGNVVFLSPAEKIVCDLIFHSDKLGKYLWIRYTSEKKNERLYRCLATDHWRKRVHLGLEKKCQGNFFSKVDGRQRAVAWQYRRKKSTLYFFARASYWRSCPSKYAVVLYKLSYQCYWCDFKYLWVGA